ncbi:MAG TPA: glycogen debranching enzyme, partial [Mycobacterium sp.]|nr:glycogen debranching enzyme [Mycobacterium sp.]
VEFHGVQLHQPDWSEHSQTLAVTVRSVIGTRMVHLILNSYERPLDFELPPVEPTLPWRRLIDTALHPPDDIAGLHSAPPVCGPTYEADAHSVVLLCADLHDATEAPALP